MRHFTDSSKMEREPDGQYQLSLSLRDNPDGAENKSVTVNTDGCIIV